MKQKPRIYYSDSQKALMWQRWRQGDSLQKIAQLFDRNHLLFGSHNSQIATLVERQTRYVMLVKTAGKDTESVINALIENAGKLPQELYKSLTSEPPAPPRQYKPRSDR